jgi:hypothetical protein
MLAQRSPKWICRICLTIQTRSSQSRGLTQISGQSSNSTESNAAQISPKSKTAPIRRVPLRELLNAKREGGESSNPEPLDKSFGVGEDGGTRRQESEAKYDMVQPSKGLAAKEQSENMKNAVPSIHTPSTTIKKHIRSKPFAMSFFPNKAPYPAQKSKLPVSQVFTQSSSPQMQSSTTNSESPESITSSEPHESAVEGGKSDKPSTEAVQSRRSKSLEPSHVPLPTAPTTRIRRLTPVKGKPGLIKGRSKKPPFPPASYTVIRTVAEPKVHPGDPTNAFPEFPGSAVREVIREKADASELDHLERISSEDIIMTPIHPKEYRPVPTLEHGLDRVLFKYIPPFRSG